MGKALELVSGYVTAPSTTFTALTMAAGNSATIRNAPIDALVLLLNAFACSQTAGVFRIRSPKLHDNVEGIRLDSGVQDPKPLLPEYHRQKLFPQDALILELTGSATGGDIEQGHLLIYYEDLPGVNGRFISAETLYARGVNTLTVENTISTGTAGGYSGEEAINAEFDLLKANTDYALVGYLVDTICGAVRWRSSDFGNLGLGGPGCALGREFTKDWFLNLARQYAIPLIPVFNAANVGNTFVDVTQDEDGADPAVTSILVELAPGAAPAAGG